MTKHQTHWDNDTILSAFREEGNPQLGEIYNHFYAETTQYYVPKNSGLDNSEIEDIYMDGLMVIFEKTKDQNFKFEVSFKSLLGAICNNLFYKALRKKRNFDKITDQVSKVHYDVKSFEKEFEFIDEFNIVMKHLDELDPKCKQVIKAFYLEGKSLESIAIELDYKNPNSAKVKRFKCLNRLIEKVRAAEPNFLNNKTEKNESNSAN